jgi:hypothetical protein
MAYNNKILGGSPLGLIGVRSHIGAGGLSTFNAGKTRNVRVEDYNKNSSKAGMVSGNSLFSGYRVVRAWPNVTGDDSKGLNDVSYNNSPEFKNDDGSIIPARKKGDYSTRKTLHNDSVYDTSILNIIEKLSGTKGALRPTDFAYLKNVGVFPNNRLMIARRFASPTEDNIMVNKKNSDLGSFATLISWVPENENFLDINFGEEWEESGADFKDILTSLGEDIGLGNLGGIAGAAGNALPLPGFTEIFQRNFLSKLGLIENDAKNSIPAGNPNLIKQSKMRKLVGYGQAASGLKTTINIKMVCEYELKYISGIDPTIVWMDLLGMIARFGTSNSETYGLSRGAARKMISWANNPNKLITDVAAAISDAIGKIIEEVRAKIEEVYNKAIAAIEPKSETDTEPNEDEDPAKVAADSAKKSQNKLADELAKSIGEYTSEAGKKALSGLLQKYRVKILGVINSLSGLPSTPWHITIGNPLRPTFCSGDMLVENVNLRLGPTLAFNDLPSSITVEFNMTNARPLGLQEIMGKFNSGYLRTVDVQKSFYETSSVTVGGSRFMEPVGILPLNDVVYGSATSSTSGTSGTSGSGNTNTDPNSGTNGTTGTSGSSNNTNSVIPTDVQNSTKAVDGQLPPEGVLNKNVDAPAITTTTTNNVTNNVA